VLKASRFPASKFTELQRSERSRNTNEARAAKAFQMTLEHCQHYHLGVAGPAECAEPVLAFRLPVLVPSTAYKI
jgi:hypothetical protein